MNAANKRKRRPKKETTTKIPYGKLAIISSIIFGALAFILIQNMSTPPLLPEIDMNKYWGSGEQAKDGTMIREFEFGIPDEVINDLKERLLHTRKFFEPIENSGSTYGVNSKFMAQVVEFWRNKYDFKERERFLNKYKHFTTKIQGLDIHFVHVRLENIEKYEVFPILLLHGWPGSFRDFYDVIPELNKPRPGKNFAFEIIVPSLPGFTLSQGTKKPGLDILEVAVIMHNLMERLGHRQYYVHGHHMGHLVGAALATAFPDHVLGFHTSTPLLSNPSTMAYLGCGAIWPSLIEPNGDLATRLYPLIPHITDFITDSGYLHLQSTRPDTIGFALEDSPVGLAAYILDVYVLGTNRHNKQSYDGKLTEYYHLTTLLDNVLLHWASHSFTSSMRLYAETFNSKGVSVIIDKIPTEVPTAGIKFKHEVSYQPDSILRQKYRNYLRSSVVETGGSFPALEEPGILASDIIEAVDSFFKFNHINHQPKQNKNKKELKTQPSAPSPSPSSVYEFTVNDIHGNPVTLDKYKGKVLIIVNVASHCGLTQTNYKQLNELYEKYYNRGLRILAFPCNQFNSQEPGTSEDILKFINDNGVKFDLFQKVEVNGENTHPLWKFLKSRLSGTLGDFIKWNFSKFIVDRNGNPVERFGPYVNPLDMEAYISMLI